MIGVVRAVEGDCEIENPERMESKRYRKAPVCMSNTIGRVMDDLSLIVVH